MARVSTPWGKGDTKINERYKLLVEVDGLLTNISPSIWV